MSSTQSQLSEDTVDTSRNLEDLKRQYERDKYHLDAPWNVWEHFTREKWMRDFETHPEFRDGIQYRRCANAPDWSKRISVKEFDRFSKQKRNKTFPIPREFTFRINESTGVLEIVHNLHPSNQILWRNGKWGPEVSDIDKGELIRFFRTIESQFHEVPVGDVGDIERQQKRDKFIEKLRSELIESNNERDRAIQDKEAALEAYSALKSNYEDMKLKAQAHDRASVRFCDINGELFSATNEAHRELMGITNAIDVLQREFVGVMPELAVAKQSIRSCCERFARKVNAVDRKYSTPPAPDSKDEGRPDLES